LGVLGIIICSIVCILQRDTKALVAYSSVVHIGFLLLVLVFYSVYRKNSALMMILAHGYVSVVIFFFGWGVFSY